MCCSFPAMVYVCGGAGCELVSAFCSSIGEFCHYLFHPCGDTSCGKILRAKGNPRAGLQALLIVDFWLAFLMSIFVFVMAFTGKNVFADDLPKWIPAFNIDPSNIVTIAVVSALVHLLMLLFAAYYGWFAAVKRKGCCCLGVVCIEGYFILYLLAFCVLLECISHGLSVWRAIQLMMVSPILQMLVFLVIAILAFVNLILGLYTAIFLCKVAGLSDEKHRKYDVEGQLVSSDDEYTYEDRVVVPAAGVRVVQMS